jgi:hypothetical protein
VGQFTLQGEGLGQITFARAGNIAQQEATSDGTVMTSKLAAKNGMVTIAVQQTSPAAAFLRKLVKYVDTAPPAELTKTTIVGSSDYMQVDHSATGCAPEKLPDGDYQQAGQMQSFVFLAEELY